MAYDDLERRQGSHQAGLETHSQEFGFYSKCNKKKTIKEFECVLKYFLEKRCLKTDGLFTNSAEHLKMIQYQFYTIFSRNERGRDSSQSFHEASYTLKRKPD